MGAKQGDDHTGVCVEAGVGGELFEGDSITEETMKTKVSSEAVEDGSQGNQIKTL